MKGAVVTALAMTGSVSAFFAPVAKTLGGTQCRRGTWVSMSATEVVDKKMERKKILASPKYNRIGFKNEKEDVSNLMSDEFTSKIVTEFKENNGRITRGDTTFRLATDYGFCWGVERAVAMAFQARQHFPDQVYMSRNGMITHDTSTKRYETARSCLKYETVYMKHETVWEKSRSGKLGGGRFFVVYTKKNGTKLCETGRNATRNVVYENVYIGVVCAMVREVEPCWACLIMI